MTNIRDLLPPRSVLPLTCHFIAILWQVGAITTGGRFVKGCIRMIPVLFFVTLFGYELFAENYNTAIRKIEERLNLIKSASNKFNIDYKILCSIIYTERTVNYDWEDDALDKILANVGLNSSMGFCQIKLKTAYWIERQLNDSTSVHFPGKKYESILSVSKSKRELIMKLTNDSLNVLYASAYLRIMISRWEKEGFSIDDRPDIIGTLYSTGLFKSNGEERIPNRHPNPNDFGKGVLKALSLFE
ncbi:MAG: hypothetical protein KJ666_08110 [Bacteroidetes bacterium]|nr:hypothetical protein [Bacteroidota bacterium]